MRVLYRMTEGRVPIVGVGGIDSAEAAYARLRAGASLLQLYTALVYEGPGLVKRIKVARSAFLIYTFLLSFTLLGGLIYRRMPSLELPTAVGLLLYGVSGFCYFVRPTVKAHFRTEARS